ncbi:MAG: helix-turn-helix domain-containing protein [Lachnospiraceae bacterium]|nr:helix-turn-helix domain-containing protein [Lachnospiraceae bacterium]
MDQRKIGEFLKRLRNEKELTQEQLAEKLGVSNRTVSRWETGNNLPDIGMLIQLAEFYDIDIREIIDGGRKSEIMNAEMKDTLEKVAEYSEYEKEIIITRMKRNSIIILISLIFVYVIAISSDLPNIFVLVQFVGIVLALGTTIENILYATRKKKTIGEDGSRLNGKFVWPVVIVCVLALLIVVVALIGLKATYPDETMWQLFGHFFEK